MPSGLQHRLDHLFNRHGDGRAVCVAADHGYLSDVTANVVKLRSVAEAAIKGGADGILLSPGQATRLAPLLRGRDGPAFILLADWMNMPRLGSANVVNAVPQRRLVHRKVLTADQALSLGATAITIYLFLGYDDEVEAAGIVSCSRFAAKCRKAGLPCIMEPLAFGGHVTGANVVDILTLGARMCVELGADGSNLRQLPIPSQNSEFPQWAPNSDRIAFIGEHDRAVLVVGADGQGLIRVADDSTFVRDLAWSPDGQNIAYSGGAPESSDIFVANINEIQPRRLTDDPGPDYGPQWSPDGQKIAFTSVRYGNTDVYVMNSDGSNLIRFTDDPAHDSSPAWSPDGQWIAFKSDRDGKWDIYRTSIKESEVTRLTIDLNVAYGLAWSPDGRHIAFVSQNGQNEDIYVMNADGTGPTLVINDPAKDYYPVWSPQ